MAPARIPPHLEAALLGASHHPRAAAARLCLTCVRLVEVDGAWTSRVERVEVRG